MVDELTQFCLLLEISIVCDFHNEGLHEIRT
jgi:hypothetical protein